MNKKALTASFAVMAAILIGIMLLLPASLQLSEGSPSVHISMENLTQDEIPCMDTDTDNLCDIDENHRYGTDPKNRDTDGDGMPDGWEMEHRRWDVITRTWSLDPANEIDATMDIDQDGLNNVDEYYLETDPNMPDSDEDGMPDGWEVAFGLDPMDPSDATTDDDLDSLSALEEYLAGTDPKNRDTDGDGIFDQNELKIHGTNPSNPDTDGDGMLDGDEIKYNLDPLDHTDAEADADEDGLSNFQEIVIIKSNPILPDTDKDGMPDGWEVKHGLDPINPLDSEDDLDLDNLTNFREFEINTNPRSNDTDGDGLNDTLEATFNYDTGEFDPLHYIPGEGYTDPTKRDTDGDGFLDKEELLGIQSPYDNNTVFFTDPTRVDTDGDSLSDYDEIYLYNTTPLDKDTDFDLLNDYEELFIYLTEPNVPDTDGDGLKDGDEIHPQRYDTMGQKQYQSPTNPRNYDTDDDGMPDGWEVLNGRWNNTLRIWTLDPTVPTDGPLDYDDDELNNTSEYFSQTDPYNPDTDEDGMPDGWEVEHSLIDPTTGKSNLDPTNPADAWQDADNDGYDWNGDGELSYYEHFFNIWEYWAGTHPNSEDSDGDGIPDGFELAHSDLDYDGFWYRNEVDIWGSDPWLWDTDGGGEGDGSEIENGRVPTDPEDDEVGG